MHDINYTDDKGRDFEVEFDICGKYSPATFYDPPEYPEIELYGITYNDKNFFNTYEKKLSQKWLDNFYKKLHEHCWDEVNKW